MMFGVGVNAEDAVDEQGQLGTIIEGYVFRNPLATLTLRYGPGVPEPAAVRSAAR